jgi:DNA repair protein RadC
MKLMVRTGRGRYREALPSEVCEQAAVYIARQAVGLRVAVSNPRSVREFLLHQLTWRASEAFSAIFLDNRHRVIAFEVLFQGTVDGANVHPREVVRRTLDHNAAAVIFAHNHPSGIAEPSAADELITGRLRDALALIDVRTLDHIIVSGDATVSFAERGLL